MLKNKYESLVNGSNKEIFKPILKFLPKSYN